MSEALATCETESHETPQAVFFDWDGTLANTIPLLFRAHNHVRELMGFDAWSMVEFYSNLRFSSLDLYPRIYGERAEEALSTLYRFMHDNHLDHIEALNGAEEILKELHAGGCTVGIVSNKRHDLLVKEIAHMGWDKYISCAVGAGQAERDKPYPDPLLKAFEQANMKPHPEKGWGYVWYVGDTVTDMELAANVGCKAVLVLNDEEKEELIRSFGPFLVINDCQDLKNTLKNSIQLVVS